MICFSPLPKDAADYSAAIARHSGDATLTYKQADGRPLLLSLYFPPQYDKSKRYPLLYWIHGGGFGSRKIFPDQADWNGDHLGFLARAYAEKGYLCACVDYRLMRSEGQAEGQGLADLTQDCLDGLNFLLEKVVIGIDRDRIVVLGESAGGYLAGALATLPLEGRPALRGAVLINAILDLTEPRWRGLVPQVSSHPSLQGKNIFEKQLLLSPCHHIRRGLCPVLLLHGAADTVVLPYHAMKYHDLAAEQGCDVCLHWIADTDHAFMLAEYMQELGTSLQALTVGDRALGRWLGEKCK